MEQKTRSACLMASASFVVRPDADVAGVARVEIVEKHLPAE
jgi:hypothetical protein